MYMINTVNFDLIGKRCLLSTLDSRDYFHSLIDFIFVEMGSDVFLLFLSLVDRP